jgi:hypothetical protein
VAWVSEAYPCVRNSRKHHTGKLRLPMPPTCQLGSVWFTSSLSPAEPGLPAMASSGDAVEESRPRGVRFPNFPDGNSEIPGSDRILQILPPFEKRAFSILPLDMVVVMCILYAMREGLAPPIAP